MKFPGLKAGEKVERFLELEIPEAHEVSYIPNQATPIDLFLVLQPPTSLAGKLVKVSYTLKVFVKHGRWNEFGEGNEVSIPVKIV